MYSAANGRLQTVLVVEDAEPIRRMVCSILSLSGYNCIEAADGGEALRVIQDAMAPLDLILTDMLMPVMGGAELARQVASLRPDLRIVFMSGYSDDPVVRIVQRAPGLFLPKPFTAQALTDKVRSALDMPWTGLPEARSSSAR